MVHWQHDRNCVIKWNKHRTINIPIGTDWLWNYHGIWAIENMTFAKFTINNSLLHGIISLLDIGWDVMILQECYLLVISSRQNTL